MHISVLLAARMARLAKSLCAVVLATLAACGATTSTLKPTSPAYGPTGTSTPASIVPSIAATVKTSAPAARAPRAASDEIVTVSVNGVDREARVHVPALPADSITAVVLALHGSTSTAEHLQSTSGFDEISDQNGFIVVYPQGLAIDGAQSWNSGQCCEPATTYGVDDSAFIDALLHELIATFPIDPTLVFVTGHSNGAIMAQALACQFADRFAAVASVAGALDSTTQCTPSRPVSMLEIHGTNDQNVLYGYGYNAVQSWSALNACGWAHTYSPEPGTTIATSGDCADGTAVELITIEGGEHDWPAEAAQQIWDFFTAWA